MIALEDLIALNNKPRKRHGIFDRDSSFVSSSKGFVIHSAVHRSTAFISKEDHADGWFSFTYWKEQGQAAVNAFIEATIADCNLGACEAHTFAKTRPEWTVTVKTPKQAFAGGGELTAERKSGRAVERVSANTWRHLHARTKQ